MKQYRWTIKDWTVLWTDKAQMNIFSCVCDINRQNMQQECTTHEKDILNLNCSLSIQQQCAVSSGMHIILFQRFITQQENGPNVESKLRQDTWRKNNWKA